MLGRLTTWVGAVAALALTAPLPAHAAPSAAPAPTVVVTATASPFSPNGDGVRDLGRVDYRLAARSYVTVRISGSGRTVLVRSLGRLGRGAHRFTWDGRAGGRVVADGDYTVTVVSRRTRQARPSVARGPLAVDARYGSLGIGESSRLSSAVVYPRTTVVRDVVVGSYTATRATGDVATIRRQVLSTRGRVVDSAALEPACETGCDGSLSYSWDGRDAVGSAVAEGRYTLRLVQGRDRAGNPRILVPTQSVTVSARRLVARTTTVTATAADTARRDQCDGDDAGNGCPEVTSRSAPSTRFAGGVSYRSVPREVSGSPGFTGVGDTYVLPVTGRVTPYDTFTVAATGGPSAAGGDDSGTLSARVEVAAVGQPGARNAVMRGDTTQTLRDVPSFAMTDPTADYSGSTGPVLRWAFGTGGGSSYDLASFEVTRTSYVPS